MKKPTNQPDINTEGKPEIGSDERANYYRQLETPVVEPALT
jgi:hypothetical protein